MPQSAELKSMPFRRAVAGVALTISSVAIGLGLEADHKDITPRPTPVAQTHVGNLAMKLAADSQPPPPPPDHCTDYNNMEAGTGNPVNQDWFNHQDARGYARVRLACVYGMGGDQFDCLDELWGKLESSWNQLANGPQTRWGRAHGIPMALPGSKMGPGWEDNVRVQDRWGLGYIMGNRNFHNPCEALAYRKRHGGY